MLEEDGRHTQRFASCLLQAYCGFRSGKQGPREVVQRGSRGEEPGWELCTARDSVHGDSPKR